MSDYISYRGRIQVFVISIRFIIIHLRAAQTKWYISHVLALCLFSFFDTWEAMYGANSVHMFSMCICLQAKPRLKLGSDAFDVQLAVGVIDLTVNLSRIAHYVG